jgi:DNA repair ATPase RecN
MGQLAEFERELRRRSPGQPARWFKADLHNHSPASFDYEDKSPEAKDALIAALQTREKRLDVLMFTDHAVLPEAAFCKQVAEKTGTLVLRGVEFNCFVDAYDKGAENVGNQLYYHILVGFDPENKYAPDYWLQEIYRKCYEQERRIGNERIKGVSTNVAHLCEALDDSGAFIIPAHLHSRHDAWKSRSIDTIYNDDQFLRDADQHFTALEVTNAKTAAFFNGQHPETKNLHKSCIWSSDAHKPADLGRRASYLLMERPCFAEVKAALELPSRTSLILPTLPAAHIVGIHVQGAFLPDVWLAFSPGCNVLIGGKGSGKTSILECLRFVLGTEVPTSKQGDVANHLQAILGASGKVRLLVQRPDGRVIIERCIADRAFTIIFEDDQRVTVSGSEVLRFPTQILGWHEIEQVATDITIRRHYMDTIAGVTQIRQLRENCVALAHEAQAKHDWLATKYGLYRNLERQIEKLEELRRGLQELTDSNLIALRDQYRRALELKESIRSALNRATAVPATIRARCEEAKAELKLPASEVASPLDEVARRAQQALDGLATTLGQTAATITTTVDQAGAHWQELLEHADAAFAEFATSYDAQVNTLSPQQRQLLESHREVLERTRALPELQAQRETVKAEILQGSHHVESLCSEIAQALDEQTRLRQEAIAKLNNKVGTLGVHLTVLPHSISQGFDELANQYRRGGELFQQLRSRSSAPLIHSRFRAAYAHLRSTLAPEWGDLLFGHGEVSFYLTRFEDDDLGVALKVGDVLKPIDQLSAGQRCTAIFPVLLQLNNAPLVVDQPEDNLDNRYIADLVAPSVEKRKGEQQLIFTSHNANLVVLSDPELIVAVDSDGHHGKIECAGFLACPSSPITNFVLTMVDGGERALERRYRKYGQRRLGATKGP